MSTDPAERLAQIRARVDQATPGPWTVQGCEKHQQPTSMILPCVVLRDAAGGKIWSSPANTEFCARARSDIPYLLDQLTERDGEIERLRALYVIERGALEQLCETHDPADAFRKLRTELGEWRERYESATVLVAKMHEAAMGCVRGPEFGVVEDVARLRTERDAEWPD